MPVAFKAISPKAIKDKAIFDALETEMGKFGATVLKDFEKTVQTWKKKPVFEILTDTTSAGTELLIGTDNEIYGYVNEGTRPHKIKPKTKKALRFKSIYAAKTKPGVIGSNPGGASGNFVFAKEVNHPGTKARKSDEVIYKKRKDEFQGRMQNAMDRGARKSGHSI